MTRKEFETQNETTRLQRFENTFFKMLDAFSGSREIISVRGGMGDYFSGDTGFRKILSSIKKDFGRDQHSESVMEFNGDNYPQLQRVYYDHPHREYKIKIYYTRFDNIIELLIQSGLKDEQKEFYLKILKTHITSEDEFGLIFP